VINNHVHPISQHDHFRNSLNSCRRRRNKWHLLHHVLSLEELATSDLKHKIDNTQSRTQPWRKLKYACISKDAYRKVGILVEHTVKVLLCGCSVPVGEDMTNRTIHPSYVWDGHCSVVWAWRQGCCLRRDRGRERETKWLATFVWCPAKKFGGRKRCQNNSGSNGQEETSPAPLLLTMKVTYIIFKNKSCINWPHKPEYCIRFYCNMKPTSKIVIPWLVRTTLSMVLYETDVYMKLFNKTSPKFGEWGETNQEVAVVTLSSNDPGWYHWMHVTAALL
jgi:hypothetical protein